VTTTTSPATRSSLRFGPTATRLACCLLVAWSAGCVQPTINTPPPAPTAGEVISVHALAGWLGMQMGRTSRYSAAMSNQANLLLIMAPPRPGVILNGTRLAADDGVIEMGGRLMVDRRLAAEIRRRLLHRRSSGQLSPLASSDRPPWSWTPVTAAKTPGRRTGTAQARAFWFWMPSSGSPGSFAGTIST